MKIHSSFHLSTTTQPYLPVSTPRNSEVTVQRYSKNRSPCDGGPARSTCVSCGMAYPQLRRRRGPARLSSVGGGTDGGRHRDSLSTTIYFTKQSPIRPRWTRDGGARVWECKSNSRTSVRKHRRSVEDEGRPALAPPLHPAPQPLAVEDDEPAVHLGLQRAVRPQVGLEHLHVHGACNSATRTMAFSAAPPRCSPGPSASPALRGKETRYRSCGS